MNSKKMMTIRQYLNSMNFVWSHLQAWWKSVTIVTIYIGLLIALKTMRNCLTRNSLDTIGFWRSYQNCWISKNRFKIFFPNLKIKKSKWNKSLSQLQETNLIKINNLIKLLPQYKWHKWVIFYNAYMIIQLLMLLNWSIPSVLIPFDGPNMKSI